VQEFKVQTSNASADSGYAAGVAMNVVLKSGTNSLHGNLFEYIRNEAFDANNYFSNLAHLPKAKFRQNQFGATVGGPIVIPHLFNGKDKAFFFGDYQGMRQTTAAVSSLSDVPPMSFRNGDFSTYTEKIYDPALRHLGPDGTVISAPFSGNIIPTSRLNPTAVAIMAAVPPPNTGASGAQSNNFVLPIPHQQTANQWDVRVDHSLTKRNHLTERFSLINQTIPLPGRFGLSNIIGGGSTSVLNSRQAELTDIFTFNPKVVNQFQAGYVRYDGSTVATDAAAAVAFANKAGLGVYQVPLETFTGLEFPYDGAAQGSAEFSTIGGGGSTTPSFENTFQERDDLNIQAGNHYLKMGTDFRRFQIDALRSGGGGSLIFGSTFTSSSDDPGSGSPFADFMLGDPTGLDPGTNMLTYGNERELYSGTYFQDDWKVSSKLTLNLGLRYDLFTQPVDAHNNGSQFYIPDQHYILPNQGGFTRAMVDGDHNNFGPHVGFEYQALHRLVIRGAYGIYYGMRDRNTQITQFAQNPPTVMEFSAPIVNPTSTISPPFNISTPITGSAGDYLLSTYTAAKPLQLDQRSMAFHNEQMPMLHEFTLDLQFTPANNWLIEASFAGTLGRDLTSGWYNRNSLPFSAALSGHNTQADRPISKINGWVIQSGSWGHSQYAALNLRLQRRVTKGLTLLANYTKSKNIEDLGSGLLNFTQYTTTIMLDSYNPKREKTYAPLDVPQVLTVTYLYDLPWGHNERWLRSGALSRVVGNWQVNGITSARGGYPSDVLTNVEPPVFSTFNVPDCVPGVSKYLGKGVDGYLNPAAFRVPETVPNVNGVQVQMYGNCSRGVVRGPGSFNTDFSAFKNFQVGERYNVQFRSEFFNLTNTPTFFLGAPSSSPLTCKGTPGGPCTNPDFGTLGSGTATGRQIQFALKVSF
jgi:hypothetical protein